MKRKFSNTWKSMAWLLVFAMIVTLVPSVELQAAAKKTVNVNTQKELDAAMKNNNVKKIGIKTIKSKTFTLKAGDYSNKKIVVKSPNAKIDNYANVSSVVIRDAKKYMEYANGNNIRVEDNKLTLGIEEGASVNHLKMDAEGGTNKVVVRGDLTKLSVSADDQNLNIRNQGAIGKINVHKSADITMTGNSTKTVKVNTGAGAENVKMKTDIPVSVSAKNDVELTLNAGAEGSDVKAKTEEAEIAVDNNTTAKVEVENPTGTKTEVAAGESTDTSKDNQTSDNTNTGSNTGTGGSTGGGSSSGGSTGGSSSVAVTGISLDRNEAEVTTGSSITLTATVTPSNATNKTVTWESSNENVAAVEAGEVTVHAEAKVGDTVKITAKAGSYSAECVITVVAKEEAPGEPVEPEDPAVPNPTLTVVAAPLADGVKVSYEATLKNETITLKTAEDSKVPSHANADGQDGYWVGFGLSIPEGVETFKYAWGEDGTLGEENSLKGRDDIYTDDGTTYLCFYVDASKGNKTLKVAFGTYEYKFKVDVQGVECEKEEEEVQNPTLTVVAAPLADGVKVSYEATLKNETITLKTAEDSKVPSHANADGQDGYWVGFGLSIPEGVETFKYAWGEDGTLGEENSLKGRDDIYTDDGTTYLCFYVDASKGNKTLKVAFGTYEYKFKVDVQGVECEKEEEEVQNPTLTVVAAPLADGVEVNYVATLEDGTITLKTVEDSKVPSHKNADGRDGYWVGFGLSIPEDVETFKYAWGEDDTLGEEKSLKGRDDIYTEDDGTTYLCFYVDVDASKDDKILKVAFGTCEYKFTINVKGVNCATETEATES